MFSYTSGACELVRHVGAAPTCRVWKTRMFLLHQCRNEMVAGVGSAPTSADFRSAAHLSEPSSDKIEMVPQRGDAPRSLAYRASALLLSYRGMKRNGGAPENRTLDAFGAQRFSGPFPRLCRTCSVFEMVPTPGFEPGTSAVRSGACRLSVTPCGLFETGPPASTRTMTIGLTGRQATLPHWGF